MNDRKFNIKDYKVVDKLVIHLKRVNKVILAIGIIIAISILIYSWSIINEQFNGKNVKVKDYLKEIYADYEFKIEKVEVNAKGYGLYSAYCTKDPNVKFYIYKDEKTNQIKDDFSQRYRKYYLNKYNNTAIKEKLTKKEEKEEIYGYEFISEFEFWEEIESYEDIENATRNLYSIYEFFKYNANIPGMLLLGGEIRQSNKGYISNGSFEYNMTLEQLIQREKENYKKQNL